MTAELERLRKSLGGELVPYGAYEPKSMGGQPDSDPDPDPAAQPALGSDPAASGWAAAREQPLGDPLDRRVAAARAGRLVGEHREGEPLPVAVNEKRGLVGDRPAGVLPLRRAASRP